jgi:hypothetical protein
MADHGSSENGILWADGHIEYKELHSVVTESVAGFAHLYAHGVFKTRNSQSLTGRTDHKLKDVNCPPPMHLITSTGVPAIPQVTQICLRNQNGALPL